MSKWKCHKIECLCGCESNLDSTYAPTQCLCFDNRTPKWKLVQNEPEQKQENTLPDWCRVGEWVYDPSGNLYAKVGKMDASLLGADSHIVMHYVAEGGSATLPYAMVRHRLNPARLRPYNAEEMRGLVGKVIETENTADLIIAYDRVMGKVRKAVFNCWCCADELLKANFTIDGKPCGVLEHLDDNGEWVE